MFTSKIKIKILTEQEFLYYKLKQMGEIVWICDKGILYISIDENNWCEPIHLSTNQQRALVLKYEIGNVVDFN